MGISWGIPQPRPSAMPESVPPRPEPAAAPLHPETLAIRTQAAVSGHREHAVPLYLTSSFRFDDAEHARALRGLALDRASNPFGPATICRAFQDAIAPLEHPAPVRTVEYRCFGAALRANCASLYASLNAAIAPLDGPAPSLRRAERAGVPATTPARSSDTDADAAGRGEAGPPDDPVGTPGRGSGPKGRDAPPPRGPGAPDGAPATPVAAELVESL